MKKNSLVFYILLLFSSCKTAEFGGSTMDVNGMMYDFENRPISGYEINIGSKYSSVSDITGRFTIQKVPIGTYEVRGKRLNYESYQGELVLKDKKQIVYIRVPSATQLLDLADKALVENNVKEAANYVERADKTGMRSTESLFYAAVILFRRNDYKGAIYILEQLIVSGTNDAYVVQFLNDLKKICGVEDVN